MSSTHPKILELRRNLGVRGEQLRDEVLFGIFETLERYNVTLVELTEYYQTKYSARLTKNRLQSLRASGRRKQIATNAVNTRWKRYYNFLEGYETSAEKATRLAGEGNEVPVQVENLSLPPEANFIPASELPSVESDDLSDILESLGGDE